jgi:hypothetical protein
VFTSHCVCALFCPIEGLITEHIIGVATAAHKKPISC